MAEEEVVEAKLVKRGNPMKVWNPIKVGRPIKVAVVTLILCTGALAWLGVAGIAFIIIYYIGAVLGLV